MVGGPRAGVWLLLASIAARAEPEQSGGPAEAGVLRERVPGLGFRSGRVQGCPVPLLEGDLLEAGVRRIGCRHPVLQPGIRLLARALDQVPVRSRLDFQEVRAHTFRPVVVLHGDEVGSRSHSPLDREVASGAAVVVLRDDPAAGIHQIAEGVGRPRVRGGDGQHPRARHLHHEDVAIRGNLDRTVRAAHDQSGVGAFVDRIELPARTRIDLREVRGEARRRQENQDNQNRQPAKPHLAPSLAFVRPQGAE